LDSNKKECYKCNFNTEGDIIIFYNLNDNPLILLKECSGCVKILSEKEDKKELIIIKNKITMSHHKYSIDYLNKATNKKELLNMKGSNTFRTSGIFYGSEKEGAPMICRICKIEKKPEYQFTVEIAPNVDNLIMIAITLITTFEINDDENADVIFM